MMRFGILTAVALLLIFGSTAEGQGIPSPSCVLYPDPLPISPDGSLPCSVKVLVECLEPLVGATVEIEFWGEASDLIAWGPGQPHPVITAVSNSEGWAVFLIQASGCLGTDEATKSFPYLAQIRVDGIVFAEPYYISSPDVVDNQGLLPGELGHSTCEDGISACGLADAVFHTDPITDGLVEPCTKFTGSADEPVNLDDAVILSRFLKAGVFTHCN